MFSVGRVIRCKFNLKNSLYTSSAIRCDKPGDEKPEVNKPKSKVKIPKNEEKIVTYSAYRKKLVAEVKQRDYENFKSQKFRKVELYKNDISASEKLKAKKELQSFTEEVESEAKVATPINDKLNSLTKPKPKKAVKKIVEDGLVESVKAVASDLGGDTKKTEDDILGYLKKVEIKTAEREIDDDEQFSKNIFRHARNVKPDSDHIEEEKMGHSFRRKQFPEQNFRGEKMEFRDRKKESRLTNFLLRKRHDGYEGLGLFKKANLTDSGPKLKIWDELEELELDAATTVPPRNYFEELIQWTKEGKLWHFPIDNDQGNEVEANVDFTEHVFLEDHLEPWCPKRGPLRHFMELVLVGLSKNYHLSVEEKKEHIYWYKEYFEGKKQLLEEMGAMDKVKVLNESVESKSKDDEP